MKKLLVIPAFAIVMAVPSAAHAAQTFVSPSEGAVVGDKFTVKTTSTNPQQCLGGILTIRAGADGGYAPLIGEVQIQGNTATYQVDLSRGIEQDGDPSFKGVRIESGPVTFVVDGGQNCPEDFLRVTYQAGTTTKDDKTAATETTEPTITPTPTPSATASPVLAPEKKKNELSPALAMLIGAVVGGALVGGAEYTAHRYKARKRRK